MGIYSTKYLESAVDGAIQDPNDVGIDLDQVEKDICGPDGIEAHSDEVDDAVEGVVGDPLEEAYEIMYESEYNFNQLMQCIGLNELSAMANGCELVLEAADSKGFFAKVKQMLVNAFARITQAFKTVISKIQASVLGDKKFATQYKAQIEAGSDTDWKFEGYDFKDLSNPNFKSNVGGIYSDFSRDFRSGTFTSVKEIDKPAIIKDVTGISCSDTSELSEKLLKDLCGGDKQNLKGKISGDAVIKILTADNEVKAIKNAYNGIKKTYTEAIGQIGKMERDVTGNDGNVSSALAAASYYSNMIRFEQNVQNIKYTCYVKAAKAKRAQARRLAVLFKNAAPANVKVQHNSANMAGGLFSGLQFV